MSTHFLTVSGSIARHIRAAIGKHSRHRFGNRGPSYRIAAQLSRTDQLLGFRLPDTSGEFDVPELSYRWSERLAGAR